jgi:large subunit ribosomal protein L22
MKRVRPAPMGRAFRVVKRTAHLTVQVTERPLKIARVATDADASAGKSAGNRRDAAAAKPARVKKTTAKTATAKA